jgi:hypothetical protein
MAYKQVFQVSWSEKDQEYVGSCANFPSLCWTDKSSVGALKGIRKLVDKAEADLPEAAGKTAP